MIKVTKLLLFDSFGRIHRPMPSSPRAGVAELSFPTSHYYSYDHAACFHEIALLQAVEPAATAM